MNLPIILKYIQINPNNKKAKKALIFNLKVPKNANADVTTNYCLKILIYRNTYKKSLSY